MKREDFSERSSVVIIAGLVVLSLLINYLYGKMETEQPNNQMRFPAYEVEESNPYAEQINSAMPFYVTADFPETWELTTEAREYDWPEGALYSPYYIYEDGNPIAMAGFNVFEGQIETIDNDTSHKIALEPLFNDAEIQWTDFAPVLNGFSSQSGTITATADGISYPSVLIYDTDLNSYCVICFVPAVLEEEEFSVLSKSVRILAQ